MAMWQVKAFVIVEAETADEARELVEEALGEVNLNEVLGREEPPILGVQVGYNHGEEPTLVPEHLQAQYEL